MIQSNTFHKPIIKIIQSSEHCKISNNMDKEVEENNENYIKKLNRDYKDKYKYVVGLDNSIKLSCR